MEIDLDAFTHLAQLNIVRQDHAAKIEQENQKAVLTREASMFFENGIVLSKYLILLSRLLVSRR